MNSGMKVSCILVGVLGGLFLAGCSEKQEGSLKPSSDGSVSVMTFNIRYGMANDGNNSWQYRKAALFKQIADLSPDIAGLQEALEFQVQEICQALPGYGSVGVGRDDGEKAGEQCCILYRKNRFTVVKAGTFWFSDTPEVAGSKSWGNNLPRICTWVQFSDLQSGNNFYAYNVHLDNESAPSRMKSVELLARRVGAREGGIPFIVTGDFNCGPASQEMRYLVGQSDVQTSRPMIDVLVAVRPEQKDIGTYNAFTGRADGVRIDMILTGPAVRILDSQIDLRMFDGRYVSDHFPVTAELRLF
jgi:endonuclease/exonuclease/phosphatase family metal-dependent hydrolase